uniref:Carboxylic ester hydrolase n=1 Tax=Macrostomum lignano TaxID=282301 RepID=A0A1I8GR16_9PLAT
TDALSAVLLVAAAAINVALRCEALTIPSHSRPERQASDNGHTVYLYKGSQVSSIHGFKSSIRGKSLWNYLGIPYAKPPVGPLRFKPTVPLDTPLGTYSQPYDASRKPKTCYYWPLKPQDFEKKNPALMMWWNNTEMSEDCLYLNVWTPTLDKAGEKGKAGKAVMVWIYGGGFFGGSSSLEVYDGAVLAATGDVVVASMQYRTGALGFMFLDDTEAPGNAGLYDQYRAIQWIHEHIHAFGGDNSRITLFGESAGAVSVSYHLLSPYTQGYFRRAILNSGSAIAWWASEDRWAASRRSLTLAKLVKCGPDDDSTDVNKIIDCMRQVTPETLQQLTWSAMSNEIRERRIQYAQYYQQNLHRNQEPANEGANVETMLYFDLPFKPVYPSDFIPKMPFMQLRDSVKNHDVKRADLLLGVVKNEGVFWIMYALYKIFLIRNREWNIPFWWGQPMDPRLSKEYEYYSKFSKELDMDTDPHNLVARYFITNINMDGLISEGTSFEYQVPSKLFGKTSWTAKETLDALDAMTSDKSFKCPTIEFAEKYALMLGRNAAHSIWMYSFEQRSELLPLPDWTGVLHGYELDYVFGSPFNERFTGKYYNYTETERQFSDDLMKFWTNFAKT